MFSSVKFSLVSVPPSSVYPFPSFLLVSRSLCILCSTLSLSTSHFSLICSFARFLFGSIKFSISKSYSLSHFCPCPPLLACFFLPLPPLFRVLTFYDISFLVISYFAYFLSVIFLPAFLGFLSSVFFYF